MVRPASNSNSPYAPVNERARGGVIKYLSDGASFVVRRRRDSAYKQMYESCGGEYRIIAEGQRVEGGAVLSSSTAEATATATTKATIRGKTTEVSAEGSSESLTTAAETHYWYIQYACGRTDAS